MSDIPEKYQDEFDRRNDPVPTKEELQAKMDAIIAKDSDEEEGEGLKISKAEKRKDDKFIEEVAEQEKKSIAAVLVDQGIVATEQQAKFLTQPTPKSVIKRRAGKGGKSFDYIEGWYVKKVLNAVFGLMWDFELMQLHESLYHYMTSKQVFVVGKMTVKYKNGNVAFVKMGFGKKDIAYPSKEAVQKGALANIPVDLGNDIKSAETDALKRCATAVGIGLDLYQKGQND